MLVKLLPQEPAVGLAAGQAPAELLSQGTSSNLPSAVCSTSKLGVSPPSAGRSRIGSRSAAKERCAGGASAPGATGAMPRTARSGGEGGGDSRAGAGCGVTKNFLPAMLTIICPGKGAGGGALTSLLLASSGALATGGTTFLGATRGSLTTGRGAGRGSLGCGSTVVAPGVQSLQ